jgi:hypothetical protein
MSFAKKEDPKGLRLPILPASHEKEQKNTLFDKTSGHSSLFDFFYADLGKSRHPSRLQGIALL